MVFDKVISDEVSNPLLKKFNFFHFCFFSDRNDEARIEEQKKVSVLVTVH
jgi:hypothetical protein